MRRIIIEQARRKRSHRQGGGLNRLPIDQVEIAAPEPAPDVLSAWPRLVSPLLPSPPRGEGWGVKGRVRES
jgi:hypothetical protein